LKGTSETNFLYTFWKSFVFLDGCGGNRRWCMKNPKIGETKSFMDWNDIFVLDIRPVNFTIGTKEVENM
jgi:hypothetical protein